MRPLQASDQPVRYCRKEITQCDNEHSAKHRLRPAPWMSGPCALFAFVTIIAMTTSAGAQPHVNETLFVWHAYRGDEQAALEQLTAKFAEREGIAIDILAIPYSAYASKLESAIPHGHGPDLFIDAHERLGTFVRDGLVAPLASDELKPQEFSSSSRSAVSRNDVAYGLPLATKCVALIVNAELLPTNPRSFADLLQTKFAAGVYPLAYESKSAYVHAAFVHGFGGRLLTADGEFGFQGAAAEQSLNLVKRWNDDKRIPEDASGALVAQLFRSGHAATAISGPWFFGDSMPTFPVRVIPLPSFDGGPQQPAPYLTVEAAFLTPGGAQKALAHKLMRYLATAPDALLLRRTLGHQITAAIGEGPGDIAVSDIERGFRQAAAGARPMPTDPRMRAVWTPAEQAIAKVLRGDATATAATAEALTRFADVTKPPAPPPSSFPLTLVIGVATLIAAIRLVQNASKREVRASFVRSIPAYGYVLHSAVAIGALVILPLAAGALSSFYAGSRLHPTFVGFGNYWQILSARGGPLLASGSFYLTLLVTILWTLVNVALHLGLGLLLGVVLARESMKLRPIYRTLLILPWAVPSYVTALAWKGLFHRQFGAINGLLIALGAEPISWFSKFSTAFTANVATNVWLGFPFMMVVTLGALTSISKDVLEAAEVDGASRWQRFRYVTLPLLRPILLPSVALGAVWTFNMFNVVFLVSGGEPDGATDILVSDAYRWAFTRDAQVGYAAAYAVLIFLLLFGSSFVATLVKRLRSKRQVNLPSDTDKPSGGYPATSNVQTGGSTGVQSNTQEQSGSAQPAFVETVSS
jgi:arabinogalactan oligomer / maltooligosaccharide transport system permease protein